MIQMIKENPPRLTPSHGFSEEFCSFVNGCVQVEPSERYTVQELSEHSFLQKDEDDLEEWKKCLDPDIEDLDTVLRIITDDLSLDITDLIKLRQSPGIRPYRRLRNTPYRVTPGNITKEDENLIRLDISRMNTSSSNATNLNENVSISSSHVSVQSSPLSVIGSTSDSDPPSRRSSRSSREGTPGSSLVNPINRSDSLESFSLTPSHELVITAQTTMTMIPSPTSTNSDALNSTISGNSRPPSTNTMESPDTSSTFTSTSAFTLNLPVPHEKFTSISRRPSSSKTPGEIRIRLLLWVVQHLADQFGVQPKDIIGRFELMLRENENNNQENENQENENQENENDEDIIIDLT